MRKPLIVVNLKTYQQGKAVLKLCRKIEGVSRDIIVGAQVGDIFEISHETGLRVYSQHVDAIKPGRNTGFVAAEGINANGAVGVMLNHSEHPLSFSVLRKTIARCKSVKLKTMVFAGNLKEALKIEKLGVDYVVFEPAELVGGSVSVSSAKPELIREIGERLKCKFLVGAGIHSTEDVRIAMKYGAVGVVLSSAVTSAKNPERVLKGLLG